MNKYNIQKKTPKTNLNSFGYSDYSSSLHANLLGFSHCTSLLQKGVEQCHMTFMTQK